MIPPQLEYTPAHVIKEYQAQYAEPIIVHTGDRLIIGQRDDQWPTFVWCTAPDGRSGWTPDIVFEHLTETVGQALRDYSAHELSVMGGEQVMLVEEIGGWWWVINTSGQAGWVPADHLRLAGNE